jgi:hypothetical protein
LRAGLGVVFSLRSRIARDGWAVLVLSRVARSVPPKGRGPTTGVADERNVAHEHLPRFDRDEGIHMIGSPKRRSARSGPRTDATRDRRHLPMDRARHRAGQPVLPVRRGRGVGAVLHQALKLLFVRREAVFQPPTLAQRRAERAGQTMPRKTLRLPGRVDTLRWRDPFSVDPDSHVVAGLRELSAIVPATSRDRLAHSRLYGRGGFCPQRNPTRGVRAWRRWSTL